MLRCILKNETFGYEYPFRLPFLVASATRVLSNTLEIRPAFHYYAGLVFAVHLPLQVRVILGFDDIPAGFYNPALTIVREQMEKLASMGAEIMVEAIRAHRKNSTISPLHRKIKPELIVRVDRSGELRCVVLAQLEGRPGAPVEIACPQLFNRRCCPC